VLDYAFAVFSSMTLTRVHTIRLCNDKLRIHLPSLVTVFTAKQTMLRLNVLTTNNSPLLVHYTNIKVS